MDQIAVDFRALEEGEASLRTAVDEIDHSLTELEGLVAELVDTWSGETAEACKATQHEWDQAVANMRQIIAEMHRLVVTAHGNHASAVRTNTGIWAV